MLLVVRVDLSDFDDNRWYEGGYKNLFENFLDSLKLQYCRLRKSSNQKLFMEKVEIAVIDKISSIEQLKRKHYSSGLISYELVETHLKEAGIGCGANVQNYLTANTTK